MNVHFEAKSNHFVELTRIHSLFSRVILRAVFGQIASGSLGGHLLTSARANRIGFIPGFIYTARGDTMAKDHIFGCGRKDVPKCRMTPLKRNIQIWVSTSCFIHFTAKLDTDSVSRYICTCIASGSAGRSCFASCYHGYCLLNYIIHLFT